MPTVQTILSELENVPRRARKELRREQRMCRELFSQEAAAGLLARRIGEPG